MLRIQLLDGFDITHEDRPVPGLHQPRLQLLLASILLHAPAPIARQQIASRFWPDSSEKQARTNLRKLLHTLRRVLPDADRRLLLTSQQIQWNTDGDDSTVDLLDFRDALDRATHTPRTVEKLAGLEAAVARYGGDLLPGQYDEWLIPERMRLRSRFADALAELATLHADQGDIDAALVYAERLLRHDPIQESAHRLVMDLHLRNDNRAAALRVYHSCASMLRDELGVDPSPATAALHQRLLRLEEAAESVTVNAAGAASLPLVGRATEYRQLQQMWHQTQRGHARLMLIQGEAGIGKTRLAEELASAAQHQGHVALYTRAFAAQGAAAYAPLADLLRNRSLRQSLAALDDIWLTELARLLPELLVERSALAQPAQIQAAWQRRRFHEALAHGLLEVGQPLLVHFDDLQWCDEETMGWLRFLFRRHSQAKLLVVGTVRTEELDADHPLHGLRHELQHRGVCMHMDLGPLAAEDIGVLAAAMAGEAVTAETTQRLYAESEGSPLFAVEIMRASLDASGVQASGPWLRSEHQGRGTSATDVDAELPMSLPPKVQAVIQARLAQLSAPARRLAEMASVIGRQFTVELLAQVSDFDDDELVTCLDELWRRRIVREQGADAYDFSHDRIRESAYVAMSPVRCRHQHAKTARAIETLYAAQLDDVSSLVAEQYAAAGRAQDAARYYLRAGDHAVAQYAHHDALRYFDRVLELAPSLPREAHVRVYLGREAIYAAWGDMAAQARQLHHLDRLLGEWPDEASTAARKAHRLATVHICWQRFEAQRGNNEASEEHGRRSVQAAAQASDPALEADAYLAWGDAAWRVANFDDSRARFQVALEKAQVADAPALMAEALELIAQTGMFTGFGPDLLMQYLREALANYDTAGNLLGRCRIENKLGYLPVAQGVGDYAEALGHYQDALGLCRQIGSISLEANILRNLGVLFCCMGQYAHAFARLREAHAVAKQSEHAFHYVLAENYLGYVYFQSGDLDAAAATQRAALEKLRSLENHHWMVKALTNLAQIHFVLADDQSALAYAHEARRLSADLHERRQESYAATVMGHVLLHQGHLHTAADAYAFALAQHQQLQQHNRAQEPRAGLADVALEQGDLPTALAHVEAILSHLADHRLDVTEEALRVYVTCRRILAAADDPRAQTLLQQAVDQLHARSGSLETDAQRERFWTVPLHQAVAEMA